MDSGISLSGDTISSPDSDISASQHLQNQSVSLVMSVIPNDHVPAALLIDHHSVVKSQPPTLTLYSLNRTSKPDISKADTLWPNYWKLNEFMLLKWDHY